MSLKEKLVSESDKVLEKEAKELAKIIEPKLLKCAKEGYRGLAIDLKEAPEYIKPYVNRLKITVFIEQLKSQLDGVYVEIEVVPKKIDCIGRTITVGYEEHLKFSW